MSGFLPEVPILPDRLLELVEESVRNFESQIPGMFLNFARGNGWVEKYRAEITRVVKEASK